MGAKLLYTAFRHHQGQNATAWPGQKLLAAELGKSVRQVQRYLRELEAAELVNTETEQVGFYRSNRYTVQTAPQTLYPPMATSMSHKKKNQQLASFLPPTPLLTKSRSRQKAVEPHVMGKVEEGEEQAAASFFDFVEFEELGLLGLAAYCELPSCSPQLAASASDSHSIESNSLHHRDNNPGPAGIEPSRPVKQQIVAIQTTEERLTTEEQEKQDRKRRVAAGVCFDCGGTGGLEVYRQCLRCETCRAGHRLLDERTEREDRERARKQAEELMPWERNERPTESDATLAPTVAEPESELARYDRLVAERFDCMERKVDELPQEVAMAVANVLAGSVSEEAERYTAAAAEGEA